MPENAYVLKQFVRLLLFGILTTPWARHSEKHRLENTVFYSLVNQVSAKEGGIIKKKGGPGWFKRMIYLPPPFCRKKRFWPKKRSL